MHRDMYSSRGTGYGQQQYGSQSGYSQNVRSSISIETKLCLIMLNLCVIVM